MKKCVVKCNIIFKELIIVIDVEYIVEWLEKELDQNIEKKVILHREHPNSGYHSKKRMTR